MTVLEAAFAAAFLVAMSAFAIGIAWLSIRRDAHSPEELRSDGPETTG